MTEYKIVVVGAGGVGTNFEILFQISSLSKTNGTS